MGGSACSSTGGPSASKATEISWSRANSNPKCPNNGPIPVEVYDNLYKEFNPTQFRREGMGRPSPKPPGMKYMVLTAKHCDGFLLWDSKVSRLQHHAHAVQAGRVRGTGQGRPRGGHADRLVLLADGLARPGLPHRATTTVFRQEDAGGIARAAEQLRQDRPALVRLRRRSRPVGPGQRPTRSSRSSSPRSSSTTGWTSARQANGATPESIGRTPTTSRPSSSSAATTTSIRGNRA